MAEVLEMEPYLRILGQVLLLAASHVCSGIHEGRCRG
jgi:hypothetical protein